MVSAVEDDEEVKDGGIEESDGEDGLIMELDSSDDEVENYNFHEDEDEDEDSF